MKVGLAQRVLAAYRVPFFDLLAQDLDGNLSLYAGDARPQEMIDQSKKPQIAHYWQAQNHHLFNGKLYFCVQSDILAWLESWDPDVLILEANWRYAMLPHAAAWMHKKGRPVIGWGLGTGNAPFSKEHFLSNFDALITYSASGAQAYQNAGFDSQHIFVACNAAARCPNRPMPVHAIEGKPIVLFVGRLQKRKRIDLLIQACAALPESLQPQLWIVGDGSIRSELESLSADVYPKTVFYGAKHGADLTTLMDQANLFVLPGTGGLALQEAMASALPVIAAEADGTQADLVRPENGRQVHPGSLDDLTNAMQDLLSNPLGLQAMGTASYRIVTEEINLEKMVEVFHRAIDTASVTEKHI